MLLTITSIYSVTCTRFCIAFCNDFVKNVPLPQTSDKAASVSQRIQKPSEGQIPLLKKETHSINLTTIFSFPDNNIRVPLSHMCLAT